MKPYSATLSIRKQSPEIRYGTLLSYSKGRKRSAIGCRELKGSIYFTIEAKDATALRAALNSVLRDIKIIEAAASARIPQKRKR